MEKIIKVGIGTYIFNDKNQVLLGLRKSPHGEGTWCPPGGHLEYGESFADGALREIMEETGLQIAPQDITVAGVTNDFFEESGKHYITIHVTAHKFSGVPEIKEADKCAKWQWFDLDNLPTNLFLSNQNFLSAHNLKKL